MATRLKLESSSPVPPPGCRSMTISVWESGIPMTVSRNPVDECPPLDLEAQPDEEYRDQVEIGNRDTDMIETFYL